jgi:hypothetical protein
MDQRTAELTPCLGSILAQSLYRDDVAFAASSTPTGKREE